MPTRRRPPADAPVFQFFGTADGVLAEITLSKPVQRGRHEWTAHLKMTGPFQEDLNVHGATKKQAIELALGLCHFHVGGRRLIDRSGVTVIVPGKPLPKPKDADDGARGERGICVCLVDEGNGSVRLVLDDVRREGATWTAETFYTHNRYPKDVVLGHELADEELAKIGMAVMARLVAATYPPKGSRGKVRGR